MLTMPECLDASAVVGSTPCACRISAIAWFIASSAPTHQTCSAHAIAFNNRLDGPGGMGSDRFQYLHRLFQAFLALSRGHLVSPAADVSRHAASFRLIRIGRFLFFGGRWHTVVQLA